MIIPSGTTHYSKNLDGSPSLFYKIGSLTYHPKHGGKTVQTLEYRSSFELWQGSLDPDRAGLLSRLIRIENLNA